MQAKGGRVEGHGAQEELAGTLQHGVSRFRGLGGSKSEGVTFEDLASVPGLGSRIPSRNLQQQVLLPV